MGVQTAIPVPADRRIVLKDVTVVIPTLGRPILERSLLFILEGSAWPGGFVVVDQGRKPEVAVWMNRLRALGIDALNHPSNQRGRAAGLNRGLENVKTRFVAITDDDCFVDRQWLANMARCLRENPRAVVTGRVEPAGEGTIMVVTSRSPATYRKPGLKFDTMSGGNMGTSMEIIRRVGFFDEDPRLKTAEDAEWSYRALCKGVPVIYAPEVCVRHFGWRDPSGRETQYRSYAASHGGFYGKYIRKGDPFILVRAAVHHLRALRWWIRGTASGNADLALSGRAYCAGLLPGMVLGFRKTP